MDFFKTRWLRKSLASVWLLSAVWIESGYAAQAGSHVHASTSVSKTQVCFEVDETESQILEKRQRLTVKGYGDWRFFKAIGTWPNAWKSGPIWIEWEIENNSTDLLRSHFESCRKTLEKLSFGAPQVKNADKRTKSWVVMQFTPSTFSRRLPGEPKGPLGFFASLKDRQTTCRPLSESLLYGVCGPSGGLLK
jgi:hypothetical protein